MKKYLYLIPLIFLFFSGHASAFSSCTPTNGYSYCRVVTLGANSTVPSTQTNFPVEDCANSTPAVGTCATVSGLNQTGAGAHVQNSNGYDIVYSSTADCSTLMNWENERYVASTGENINWIKVSSLPSAGVTVTQCYGNPSISSFQGGATGSAWNANYAAVYHLPNGSTLNGNDSTANANNGTNNGATGQSGQIDGSAAFNGSSGYVDDGNGSSLNITGDITLEAWVNPSVLNSAGRILSKLSGNPYHGYELFLNAGQNINNVTIQTGLNSGSTNFAITNAAIPTNTWTDVVATITGGTYAIYFNGVAQTFLNTAGSGTIVGDTTDLNLGRFTGTAGSFFQGALDEVRISNNGRPQDWVTTEYNNQSNPSNFETFGSETNIPTILTPIFQMFGHFISFGHFIHF